MTKNQNEIVNNIYESLTTSEKCEMVNLIIENGIFDLNSIYNSFDHNDKIRLSDKLYQDDYFYDESKFSYDEKVYNEKNKLNIALLSLLDKSYMLTKSEIEYLLNIANQYKYF